MNSDNVMCKPKITASKETLCAALYAFINQRSGIEYANYQCGDWKATRKCFNGDYLPMLRHGKQARHMLRYVELSGITAESLVEATRAYSGRLQFNQREDGKVAIEYTTGQYFPTEYRKAACAVLAQAIWDHFRSNCMPEPTVKQYGSADNLPMRTECLYDGLSAGDWLRRKMRREFGRAIASTWFN